MAVVRWYPRRGFDFSDDFQRMWDEFLPSRWGGARETMWQPRVDINETKDSILVTAEIPGLTEKDVKITLKENHLVISGEKKSEDVKDDENYHCCERRYGKFERAFVLSTEIDVDKVEAKVKDGILRIKMPKAEKVKPKEITIKAE